MTTVRRDGGSVQECFFATVESFDSDGHIRVATVSTGGEDGMAWILLSDLPESVRAHLDLGTVFVILVEVLGENALNTIHVVR